MSGMLDPCLQLTVLFGLPTLVLLIPWLVQEPSGLALVAPLLLLVPGPRGIIQALFTEFFLGVTEAKDVRSNSHITSRANRATTQPKRVSVFNASFSCNVMLTLYVLTKQCKALLLGVLCSGRIQHHNNSINGFLTPCGICLVLIPQPPQRKALYMLVYPMLVKDQFLSNP